MAGTVRINSESLRSAARAEAATGEFVSGLGADALLTDAGTAVSGLLSEGACQFAGSVVGAALSAVGDDLSTHSAKLSTAADSYQGADEEFGRRLHRGSS